MSSSRRSTNPRNRDGGSEPFPSFPAGPSSQQDSGTQSTSHTVTTTTVFDGRNDPITTTQTQHPVQNGTPTTPSVVTTAPGEEAPVPFSRTTVNVPSSPIRRRPIGIRRLPSGSSIREGDGGPPSRSGSGRRRSNSAPQDNKLSAGGGSTRLTRQSTREPALETLREEGTQPGRAQQNQTLQVPGQETALDRTQTSTGVGRRRSVSNAARSILSRRSDHDNEPTPSHEYENEVVDYLDVIDPEVSTLTTLTNVQNSLFVPDLGRWLNRRPTYTLSRAPSRVTEQRTEEATPTVTHEPKPAEEPEEPLTQTPSVQRTWSWQRRPPVERSHSISSVLTDSHYAVLPHGVDLADWSDEDKEALDDHVRHMLHSRRSKFKQRMKAFGKYVSKPLGFFVTLYAFLITMFGLAWVLFLIGWIYVDNRQSYLVNVIDNVLVALFAVVGDGMAPFRIVDTYHMIWIAKYHYKTWELREKKKLPNLQDHNDLPETLEKNDDAEAGKLEESEYTVLTRAEQKKLIHHQTKFSKSHSFYKPHETTTHHAFPIKLMITAVVLLDFHSIFQIMLGTFTWSWDYHSRPSWITTVILCLSISVNILAGVIISIGDRRTRKKDVVMRMTRQDLTSEAIKKVKKHKADRDTSVAQTQQQENLEVIREGQVENSTSRSQEESSGSFQSARSH